MRYSTFLKHQETATPYANQANCRKCAYGEWVRTSAFCSGFGRSKKIPYKSWDTDKVGYCSKFIPKSSKEVKQDEATG